MANVVDLNVIEEINQLLKDKGLLYSIDSVGEMFRITNKTTW
ncbi:MAG: hypothetical protein ACLR9T_03085 [Thomasclavelia sp.]